MEDAPAPELFVARDRARRFARYLREALQERRLHYRGADVGLAALVDEADEALAAVLEDLRRTLEDLLAHRIRDRERGYMELPLAVMAEGLTDRVDLARRLDAARRAGGAAGREAGAAVLALLDDALLRIDAYCGAYDEKRPMGPRREADLAHLLEAVERHAGWRRALGDPRAAAGPAFDRPPPRVQSDPGGLEDLLRALRAALPAPPGPWRVEPGGPGTPLTLSLGTPSADAREVEPPGRVARALEVLRFLHPVAVTCWGREEPAAAGLLSPAAPEGGPALEALRLDLPDEAAGKVELSLATAAGSEAALRPEDERAVRALLQAPPLPDVGPPPPGRMVALMGVLRALDAALRDRVLPRADSGAVRVAASRLPRETTRKAPLLRALTAQLEGAFPGFPTHRAEEVTRAAAEGKLAARHATAADAAVLLALFARPWSAGGRELEGRLDLAPLEPAEVEETVRDLCTIATVRKELEAGRTVDAVRLTRLERALVAVLGRLGRCA